MTNPRHPCERLVSIYRIIHVMSGRSYVGITSNDPLSRWRQHIALAFRKTTRKRFLQKAIQKYGADAFEFEVIGSAKSMETATVLERFFIAELGTLAPRGFNLTSGGETNVGVRVSESTRQQKANAASAYWKRRRLEFDMGLIDAVGHKSHSHSEETKQKIAALVTKAWETRARRAKPGTGAKISAGNKAAYKEGRHQNLTRDHSCSQETKVKLSHALKAVWAAKRAAADGAIV